MTVPVDNSYGVDGSGLAAAGTEVLARKEVFQVVELEAKAARQRPLPQEKELVERRWDLVMDQGLSSG